jgi:sulfur-oxidizing protein SoxZ
MSRAILRVPPKAKPGEIISVKTLIQHKMESGFRYTSTGERVPRDIVTKLVATWDGEEIYACDLSPAIAANPFVAFTTRATKTGTLRVTWTGDNGFTFSEEARIVVG